MDLLAPNKDAITYHVYKVLQSILPQACHFLTRESRLREDLHCDSLETVELLWELEEIFNVHFTTEEIDEIHTVEQMVCLIHSKTQRHDLHVVS